MIDNDVNLAVAIVEVTRDCVPNDPHSRSPGLETEVQILMLQSIAPFGSVNRD